MGAFTAISQDAFDSMQLEAGVLLKSFNPANPTAPSDNDIVCATTGGIKPSCVPTYSDMGADVDNCPNNTLELKHLDAWECKLGFTALNVTEDMILLALGAADKDSSTGAIKPRKNIKPEDFKELWWVGDRADGGCAAIKLINAISTAGLSMQTNKNGKTNLTCELTGHYSLEDPNKVPMEFYSIDPKS